MSEKIKETLVTYGPLALILITSAILWFVNRSISIVFLFDTFFLYVAIYCISSIISNNRQNKDIQPGAIIFMAIYLFLIFVPSLKFYTDLVDYSKGNYSIIEGVVTKVETPRGYEKVYINNLSIDFWDWSKSSEDYPLGKARIHYLTRSRRGLSFEIIK